MSLPTRNLVIVGAGIAGRLLAADIKRSHAGISVIGFVDDEPRAGDTLLGVIADFPKIHRTYKIDEIAVAVPSADGSLLRRVLLANLDNRVSIRIIPREPQVMRDLAVSYEALRDITPDDFLGRPVSRKNVRRLESYYKNRKVLVTGGAGSIGSEIVEQLLYYGAQKVIIYDNSELLSYQLDQSLRENGISKRRYAVVLGTVTNERKVRHVITAVQPDVIFHVAAYKHVHLMEDNIDEALRINVLGTRCVVDAARAAKVSKFVFVSTDKVVNPTSVMGASKGLAELYVRSVARGVTKCSIVRFGNVINSHGSVLPLFDRQIHNHRYITLTSKRMKRFFMSIREAAELVLLSGTRSSQGAVYVLDMGDLVRLHDVARCFIRSHNLRPNKDVELRVIGKRPGEKLVEKLFTDEERSAMRKTSLPNIWQLLPKHAGLTWRDTMFDELTQLLNVGSVTRLRAYLRTFFPLLHK